MDTPPPSEVIFEVFELCFFITPTLAVMKNDSDYAGRWELQAGWLCFNLRVIL